MVNVRISEDSYHVIRSFLANTLEGEMLHGRVEEWDSENELIFKALVELNAHAVCSAC